MIDTVSRPIPGKTCISRIVCPISISLFTERALNVHEVVEQKEAPFGTFNHINHIPYGIKLVKADEVEFGSYSRTVCMIGTGFDKSHPDLPNDSSKVDGAGFCGPGNSCEWDEDHVHLGTHEGGIIAALGTNDGLRGIVPKNDKLNLHIVRVFSSYNSHARTEDIFRALDECQSKNANIIHFHLFSSEKSDEFQTKIDALHDAGIIMVAPAGSTSKSFKVYPASYNHVLSVASVNSNKEREASNYNDKVDLAAPGQHIYSTIPNGKYAYKSSTALAAAHVTGVAALVWSHDEDKTSIQIIEILQQTAEDLGSPNRDDYYGHGLVNALSAYNVVMGNPAPTPGPTSHPVLPGMPTKAPTSQPTPSPTASPTVQSGDVYTIKSKGNMNKCLEPNVYAEGSKVRIKTCKSASAKQKWSVTAEGLFKNLGGDSMDLCLKLLVRNNGNGPQSIRMAECADNKTQRFGYDVLDGTIIFKDEPRRVLHQGTGKNNPNVVALKEINGLNQLFEKQWILTSSNGTTLPHNPISFKLKSRLSDEDNCLTADGNDVNSHYVLEGCDPYNRRQTFKENAKGHLLNLGKNKCMLTNTVDQQFLTMKLCPPGPQPGQRFVYDYFDETLAVPSGDVATVGADELPTAKAVFMTNKNFSKQGKAQKWELEIISR